MKLLLQSVLIATMCLSGLAQAQDTPVYFAPDPGVAQAEVRQDGFAVWNRAVSMSAVVADGRLDWLEFENRLVSGISPERLIPFVLLLGDGSVLRAAEMKMAVAPRRVELDGQEDAFRLAERIPGKAVVTEFEDVQGRLQVTWRVILRDGSNYVRQEVVIAAKSADVPVREVRLVDWRSPVARVVGTSKGSPIVAGLMFAGFEDPLSTCAVAGERARCWVERELPLKAGQVVTYSSVAGVISNGQLRRGFLHYLERERAHPYRTFLNYNSWYDLGYFSSYDEGGALNVINTFGTELTKKRGVPIASFLFDDGWDDPSTLWQFNAGFPDGFTKLRAATAAYNTAPGV